MLTLQRWAEHKGWICKTRRTVLYRIDRGANTGRRLQIMEAQDAGELYKLIHRHPTAVIQIGQPTIRLDPSAIPSERNSISLERFVRYKAFFRMLGRAGSEINVEHFLAGFQDWQLRCACGGERDARCIPLHVFSPSREWRDLHDVDGVKAFECRHGQASSRVDDKDRDWNPPKARHGREAAIVAGTTLSSGFHWDVVSPRGDGRLCTSTETWRFSRESYCNVYPDAAVRKGQRRGGSSARLVYQAQRPDDTLTNATRSQRSQRSDVPRRSRRR